MSSLIRFGISLDKELSDKFDENIKLRSYGSRSEAVRDLIREYLVRSEWDEGAEVAGAVTLIYDHHKRELLNRITGIQHDYQEVIISAQHVHLDHHNCLEIVAVKGAPSRVRELADKLKAVKGVMHATLSMSSTGKGLK